MSADRCAKSAETKKVTRVSSMVKDASIGRVEAHFFACRADSNGSCKVGADMLLRNSVEYRWLRCHYWSSSCGLRGRRVVNRNRNRLCEHEGLGSDS